MPHLAPAYMWLYSPITVFILLMLLWIVLDSTPSCRFVKPKMPKIKPFKFKW